MELDFEFYFFAYVICKHLVYVTIVITINYYYY